MSPAKPRNRVERVQEVLDSLVAKQENDRDEFHSHGRTSGRVQFSGPSNERQRAVVKAFEHAWNGYRKHAWGYDHLRYVIIREHFF